MFSTNYYLNYLHFMSSCIFVTLFDVIQLQQTYFLIQVAVVKKCFIQTFLISGIRHCLEYFGLSRSSDVSFDEKSSVNKEIPTISIFTVLLHILPFSYKLYAQVRARTFPLYQSWLFFTSG